MYTSAMHTAIATAAMLASFYITPNGAVIDWYGHVIAPATIVQVITTPKPIKVVAPKAAPITKPVELFKPFNDICWYGSSNQFDIVCGG